MKIYIESSGCTRRKLDVAKFHDYFKLNGHEIVSAPEKADHILVTTCAFKAAEEDHSVALIDRLNRHPARVLVYGCLPDIAPTKYHRSFDLDYLPPRKIDEIDRYFPNSTYKFADITDSNVIRTHLNHQSWSDALGTFTRDFEWSVPFMLRAARYLKNKLTHNGKEYFLFTSRGCLGRCTYCAVRFATGTIRSKPLETVLDEFRKGLDSGFHDFTLLGDDVGAYGQDKGRSFPELLEALLQELEQRRKRGDARVARVNLHIDEINPRWIVQFRKDLARLITSRHIKSLLCPLQSGSNRILELMSRGHDSRSIEDVLLQLRDVNPQLTLSSQVIIGFPSETDTDFEDSLGQLRRIDFDSVTLFPYDDKEKTPAAKLQPKIPAEIIQQRMTRAHHFLRKRGIRAVLSCNE